MNKERYRTKANTNDVVAFSISWQRENLLARGLGLEHLRELLIRLARPILRTGASLAYGGCRWEETEDNFTYDLLRLISAEQEDNSLGGPDTNLKIGRLYLHAAWPKYLEVTPKIEAQWINCCRIVRVTQAMAGFAEADIVPDHAANDGSPKSRFNAAASLSAVRRKMMETLDIPIPDTPTLETISEVTARILLGGKVSDYTAFVPGIFEEALVTLRAYKPLYILGGFGGAAEVMARMVLQQDPAVLPEFTLDWQKQQTPRLADLLEATKDLPLPPGLHPPEQDLQELADLLISARHSPAAVFNTGLTDEETRELLQTSDVRTAVRLVRQGLTNRNLMSTLAA